MAVKRMDNVGIVVADLDAAIAFFGELGLELEGRAPIEGEWADGVTGLRDMRVEIAMMRTPDGHSRLELSRFLAPPVVADHRRAPVNALGYLRVMFAVDDLDETLARLDKLGATIVGDVVRYENMYPALLHPGAGGHPDRARRATRATGFPGRSDVRRTSGVLASVIHASRCSCGLGPEGQSYGPSYGPSCTVASGSSARLRM